MITRALLGAGISCSVLPPLPAGSFLPSEKRRVLIAVQHRKVSSFRMKPTKVKGAQSGSKENKNSASSV
jgi:hypothetical protein